MKEIIKFTDTDIDGCGTDIVVYVQIEGDRKLTTDDIVDIKSVIDESKRNIEDWSTDDILDAVCDHLASKGFTCQCVYPDHEIEF